MQPSIKHPSTRIQAIPQLTIPSKHTNTSTHSLIPSLLSVRSIKIKVRPNQAKHQTTAQGSFNQTILNGHISRTFPSSFQISNQAIPKQPHSSHKAPGQSVTTTSQTHSLAKLPTSPTQGLPTHLPVSQFYSWLGVTAENFKKFGCLDLRFYLEF